MKTQFLTDKHGKKVAVLLPIKTFNRIVEELEDLDDVRLFRQGMADRSPSVSMEVAFKKIEAKRKKK